MSQILMFTFLVYVCLYCIAKGLQHLRHNKYVHRDIKPGNIMRCQKPDGRYFILYMSSLIFLHIMYIG